MMVEADGVHEVLERNCAPSSTRPNSCSPPAVVCSLHEQDLSLEHIGATGLFFSSVSLGVSSVEHYGGSQSAAV